MTASVTVGFVPKDRFHPGPGALKRLLEVTEPGFRLVVVDCGMPVHYRRELEAVLDGRPEVDIVRTEHYTSLGEAKNLAAKASQTEFTCLIENDMFVNEGWLTRLLPSKGSL